MNSLAVESKKTFRHGFILNEIELRRIVDLIREQARKLVGQAACKELFTIKFKNGVIAETDAIDTILLQENSGSALIVRLRYELLATADSGSCSCSVEFFDPRIDEDSGSTSIKFTVRANDRDWVFVTSSQLEERIERVKRRSPGPLGERVVLWPVAILVAFLTFFIINMAYTGANLPSYLRNDYARWLSVSAEFRDEVERRRVNDPVAAMVLLEEIREKRASQLIKRFFEFRAEPAGAMWIYAIFAALSVVLAAVVIDRYYPLYNFCWGDYLELFQRRERMRSFWLVVVGVGLIVELIGGMVN